MSPELNEPHPNLPSGFISAEQLPQQAVVSEAILPWMSGGDEAQLTLAECRLQNGASFLLASAIGTHPKLTEAAAAMTDQQRENADNMFYSRIQNYLDQGHAPNVETMADVVTDFPIKVMRNHGGQRVYFGLAELPSTEGGQTVPVVLKLGVCDKNRQKLVTDVLSSLSPRARMRKNSRGTR